MIVKRQWQTNMSYYCELGIKTLLLRGAALNTPVKPPHFHLCWKEYCTTVESLAVKNTRPVCVCVCSNTPSGCASCVCKQWNVSVT